MRNHEAQNLLIDADDTLWENNIYYERVIQETLGLLDGVGADCKDFRRDLDAAERRRIPLHGYGTVNFTHSLVETLHAFLPPGADPSLPDKVKRLSLAILAHPVEFCTGVPETLKYLEERHALFLVTKGEPEEQARKIRDSKLGDHFQGVEILREKDMQVYCQMIDRLQLDPSKSWMIGNSPRSDINPALAAGIHAVYIPHEHTWTFEHEEPMEHPKLIRLQRFPDLKMFF